MSDDDDVVMPRRSRPTRRALRVPVDDVPRRSAVSDLPPASEAAEAAGEAALVAPPAPVPQSEPPRSAEEARQSSYPPPPAGGQVVMRGTVRVASESAADEADMLDPFAEMPDADVDPEPLQPESTQVLADDDLESLEYDGGDSVEVRIDELEGEEAEAVVQAAIASGAVPPPSAELEKPPSSPQPPQSPSPEAKASATDTVPGVDLEDLGSVAADIGVVDEPDDDEPVLTVTQSDELELDDELEEIADDDLDEPEDDELELDEDAIEEAGAPPAPPEKAAPPAPPEKAAAPPVPPEKAAPPAPREKAAPPTPPEAPASPPGLPDEKKKKRRKPWFEGFFSDDYLRTVRPPTPKEVARECDFIIGQLGLPRGSTILDVGCGLGLHAIELTRRGYLVVGLDLSLPMLSRAGDEAQDEGLRINFLHGDMRQMTFEGQFDAVLCWGTTFGYFDDDGNSEVVQRLLEALKPKGLLLLDIVNRDHVLREQPNLVWFEGDGCVCMEESRFDYLRSRLHVKRTVILDDGRQRENTYSLRLYSAHEIGQLLHQKGFRVAKLSGMQATPGVFFGETSPRLIILAERRPESAVSRSTAQIPAPPEAEAGDTTAETSAETKPGTEVAPPPAASEDTERDVEVEDAPAAASAPELTSAPVPDAEAEPETDSDLDSEPDEGSEEP